MVEAGTIVRRNRVVNTEGSMSSADSWAVGILAGSVALVEKNTVSGLYPVGSGSAYGINVDMVDGVVRDNTVSGSATPPAGYGIYVGVGRVTVVDNATSNFSWGVYHDASAGGIYARNVADGCTTKYSGGTAGTGND